MPASGQASDIDQDEANVVSGKKGHDAAEGQHRDHGRHEPANIEVVEGVHIGADPAQQVAAPMRRQASGRQRLDALEEPDTHPRRGAAAWCRDWQAAPRIGRRRATGPGRGWRRAGVV